MSYSIYKSAAARERVLELYDRQLRRHPIPWEDIYADTSFGATHVIETGKRDGIPLLVFHGGNATSAYTLLTCSFLWEQFHVYAVDTIGHPGKSAETRLDPRGELRQVGGRDDRRARV